MNINIRNMMKEDFEQLREIDIAEQKRYLGEKWNENNLLIKHPLFGNLVENGFCLVAEMDENIAGFIVVYPLPAYTSELFVKYIVTAPQFRNQGVATILYRSLIDIARRKGIKRIWGVINFDNPKSKSLHTKLGFKIKERWEAEVDI